MGEFFPHNPKTTDEDPWMEVFNRPADKTRETNTDSDLHICQECGDEKIQLDLETQSPEDRTLMLRCPECEHLSVGVYDWKADELFDFDDARDEALEYILQALRRMTKLNQEEDSRKDPEEFKEDVERLIDAINRDDGIEPMDF